MTADISTVLKVFRGSRLFGGKKLTPPLRQILNRLPEGDVLLRPRVELVHLGAKDPKRFEVLNIGHLRIVSTKALTKPEYLLASLEGLAEADSSNAIFKQIVDGVKRGVFTIKEVGILRPQPMLPEMITREMREEIPGLREISADLDFQAGRLEYYFELYDPISGRPERFGVLITPSTLESGRQVSITAALPWNSPYLVGVLNQLFGQPWLYKSKNRFAFQADYHQIAYFWFSGSFSGLDVTLEEFKLSLVLDVLQEEMTTVLGAALDANILDSLYAKEGKPPTIRPQLYPYIERSVQRAIDSFTPGNPKSDVIPEFYWDLGVIRETIIQQ